MLVQSAPDKGPAYRDEDGQVYALREITRPEYIEMDRENRIRKWEALTEEEKIPKTGVSCAGEHKARIGGIL